jgi:putative ABC transport system permease protein
MITIRIAIRSLLRRKSRMALIAVLVIFGTLLLVYGTTLTRSAGIASRMSIIRNFTGDFIVYSAKSREIPSPFAFNTPLPVVPNLDKLTAFLSAQPEVEAVVPYAQNYSQLSLDLKGSTVDVPFIFYAVPPVEFFRTFANVKMVEGDFFTSGPGIMISQYQNDHYEKRYGVRLTVGQDVTVLALSEGGGVNAFPTKVRGIFEPLHYRNVFNYINFMDMASYSQVFNFTGVARGSLPAGLEKGLAAAQQSEDAIFALAGAGESIDTSKLKSESISGYTMVAVLLKDHGSAGAVRARIDAQGLDVKTSPWDEASGFFSRVAAALEAFIWFATGLIFLVVAFIFANTLIISIIERTAEIGTMRALGGEKSFIRRILLSETLLLNLAACLVGMTAGLVLVLVTRRAGLPLPDTISQYLVGGGPLPLILSPGPFVTAVVVVAVVSVVATIFPLRLATRITPLAAMNDR